MGENVSPYVDFNRAWIVKDSVAKFLHADELCHTIYAEFQNNNKDVYSQLVSLSELLWEIREQLYLIYRRPIKFKESEYEVALKYTPSQEVMQFINTIALLFHKVLITRELCYTTEYYEMDLDKNHGLSDMLEDYVVRIQELFKVAQEYVIPFMAKNASDAVVLCYLLENEDYVQSVLNVPLEGILKQLNIKGGIEEAYVQVIEFCNHNGWKDRGRIINAIALRKWPKNKKLSALQQALK